MIDRNALAERLRVPSAPLARFEVSTGWLEVIDVWGGDPEIVQAARTSYGPSARPVRDDAALIDYLTRHRHGSPLEMPHLKCRIQAPVYVARQWMRYRTANLNEHSLRYSEPLSEGPVVPVLTSQAGKQSSSGVVVPDALEVSEAFLAAFEESEGAYRAALGAGVAREKARAVLPLATPTRWIWAIDARNLLFGFLAQRLPGDAQHEIREFAGALALFCREWIPATWGAFDRHVLNALAFSADEIGLLRSILSGHPADEAAALLPSAGRQREFLAKVDRLLREP